MARGDLQIQDLRVLLWLSQARGSVTTKQISERFELPLRTVQRIVNAIEAAGLPMKRDSVGMGGGIRLLGELTLKVALPSNLVEMAALDVACDRMRDIAAGTVLCEALEQFVERTRAKLTTEQRSVADHFAKLYRTKHNAPQPVASPVAALVHKAMDGGRVLLIDYLSPKETKPRRRAIEPAGMWLSEGRTYVLGVDRDKKAVRTFALDRIRDATLSDETFTPSTAIDVASYFQSSLGAFVGAGPVALEVQLDAEAVRRLGSKRPSPSARLVKRGAGALLSFAAPLSDELVAWMVTLGPGVTVLAPKEAVVFVRDAFAARASAQQQR